jgi:radical SAM/Cys-rich protein
MQARTVERLLELLVSAPTVHTVDLTGGAPELNQHFRTLVREARALGKRVIDRCNLTVLCRPGQEDTAEFLTAHGVNVVASLPCYTRDAVERQRGQHVFDPSLRALHSLNELGYGRTDSGLELDLVHNPIGATLPPSQAMLEATYRRELAERFGIVFNRLFTITNMPITRFLRLLEQEGRHEQYMQTLLDAFNPQAALRVMCRNLLSVSWNGELFDCDFNQAVSLPLGGRRRSLWEIASFTEIEVEPIAFADHCYGCTAAAGSSCGGSLV